MDPIDVKILRMLYWSPFNPVDVERGPMGIWDIARSLDVHGNTIKRRLADMEKEGVLHGLSFFPNAILVGVKVGFYAFRFADDDQCDRAAETVFERQYPGATMRMSTPELRFNIPAPADQDPDDAAEALAQELGAKEWDAITYRHWESEPLSDLETRVLRELHKDLFATPPQMAAALQVTPKTVRRCIESLRNKKAFCVVPLVDPMQAAGMQATILDIDVGNDPHAAAQVWRSFPDLLPNGIHEGTILNFIAFTPTPADLAAMLQELRSMTGVKQVLPHVPQRLTWTALPSGLEKISERMMEKAALA